MEEVAMERGEGGGMVGVVGAGLRRGKKGGFWGMGKGGGFGVLVGRVDWVGGRGRWKMVGVLDIRSRDCLMFTSYLLR